MGWITPLMEGAKHNVDADGAKNNIFGLVVARDCSGAYLGSLVTARSGGDRCRGPAAHGVTRSSGSHDRFGVT